MVDLHRVVFRARPESGGGFHRGRAGAGDRSASAVNVDALRTGLERAGFLEPQVQILGSSREAAIRLPPQAGQSGDVIRTRVEGVLHAIDAKAEVTSLDVVGSQVGDELKSGAIKALGATLALIFLYIALRFHTWRLSFGAILAVLHDPILVLGAFSLWHTSFDLPVVVGDAGGDRLFAQRHRRRVRPHSRALRRKPPARAGRGARPVDQPDAVANHHDEGGDVDRRRRAVRPRRPGAARDSPRR